MTKCWIESNSSETNYKEPEELYFSHIDQALPAIKSINDVIDSNLKRIREIVAELRDIYPKQILTNWFDENNVPIDVSIWLKWIQLQSEKCWLEAWNKRLKQSRNWILEIAWNLARKDAIQFTAYKEQAENELVSVVYMRALYIADDKWFNVNEEWMDSMLDYFYPHVAILYSREEVKQFIEKKWWLEEMKNDIQNTAFDDIKE